MAVLDLAACPICQARDGLARQTTKIEGRSQIAYECSHCGSVLLWLGDELWLDADRWAYQHVGRPDKSYLLHQTLTAAELRALVDPRPSATGGEVPPRGREPAILTRRESAAGPPARSWPAAAPAVTPPPPVEQVWEPVPQAAQVEYAAVPVQEAATPQEPVRRQRSRGSPFLVVSVALILLCLVCTSAAMIASTAITPQTPTALPPAALVTGDVTPVETPLPTATATTAQGPPPPPDDTSSSPAIASPAPTAASAVVFQGVTSYLASTGSHYVVGEVVNTSGDDLRFVEILASFYDTNGQMVATGSTFAELTIVEAGGRAPFRLATLDPPPSLVSYKLRSDYLATTQDPLRLEILNHSASVDDGGWHHVAGEVRNPYDFVVRFPEIVATYYNATLQVVRVEVTFAELESLQPGQSSAFEVILVDPPADLQEYNLLTEAVRE